MKKGLPPPWNPPLAQEDLAQNSAVRFIFGDLLRDVSDCGGASSGCAAGPPGPPGKDGAVGEAGSDGEGGSNGLPGMMVTMMDAMGGSVRVAYLFVISPSFRCVKCPAGEAGAPGPDGPPGSAG